MEGARLYTALVAGDGEATVLLLSDGLANVGQEKRRAGEALRNGDAGRAAASCREAAQRLEELLTTAAPEMRSGGSRRLP